MTIILLKSDTHNISTLGAIDYFKRLEKFVDVSFWCEGYRIPAHRIVLSSGSDYLHKILLSHTEPHPVILITDIRYAILKAVVEFLYKGEINILKSELGDLLKAAKALEISGLVDVCKEKLDNEKLCSESSNLFSEHLSERNKHQRQSVISRNFVEDFAPKTEIPEILVLEHESSFQTDTLLSDVNTESTVFLPKITSTQTLSETSDDSSSKVTYVQNTGRKEVSTECNIQPLQVLESNVLTSRPKSSNQLLQPKISDGMDKLVPVPNCILNKNPKNRRRSLIWKYFTIVNEQKSSAACKICRRAFSFKTSVTNLSKHMKKRHKRYDLLHPPHLPDVQIYHYKDKEVEEVEEADMQTLEDEEENQILEFEYDCPEDIPSTSAPFILKFSQSDPSET